MPQNLRRDFRHPHLTLFLPGNHTLKGVTLLPTVLQLLVGLAKKTKQKLSPSPKLTEEPPKD